MKKRKGKESRRKEKRRKVDAEKEKRRGREGKKRSRREAGEYLMTKNDISRFEKNVLRRTYRIIKRSK